MLDIDRTEFGLDSILELVDAEGNTLAISNDSRVESANQAVTYSSLGAGTVLPLQQSSQPLRNRDGSYRDLYSLNSTDAGMRILLPGTPGTKGNYSLRVRSNPLRPSDTTVATTLANAIAPNDSTLTLSATATALGLPVAAPFSMLLRDTLTGRQEVVRVVEPYNPASATLTIQRALVGTQATSFSVGSTSVLYNGLLDQDRLTDGLSSGSYHCRSAFKSWMSFGGSTIRYADIRYATNGVTVQGLPNHSPLSGNVTFSGGNTALGQLAESDRGVLSAGGTIVNGTGQHSYSITINRPSVVDGDTLTQAADATSGRVSTTVDVDYADGLGRPNLTTYIYRGDILVAMGTDSNIVDDLGDSADLSAGSLGKRPVYRSKLNCERIRSIP